MEKILQQIKIEGDTLSLAEKYYKVLFSANNLQFANREVQLVAFAAVKGTISGDDARKEFCEKYNTTISTINNTVSKMRKLGILIKKDGGTKVNPKIALNFSERDVIVTLKLLHEKQ